MLRLSLALAVTAALLAVPTASAAARPFTPRPIHNVSGVASPPGAAKRPLAHAAQAGSTKWIEGGLKYQYGTNCIILGGAYSEPMVASYVRYGGLDHLPRVGETYTASIVVGVTGNPCPFGYGYVYTELVLPRGTQLAPGQAIQCLGVNRNGATENLTNATWRDPANSSLTGRYCPTQASGGSYGGIGFGFRPLAQGQIFELRVKVVSSVALNGAAASPADTLGARIEATGVYSNPAAPRTWINVLPAAQVPAPVSISYPNPPYVSAAPASPGAKATTDAARSHLHGVPHGLRVLPHLRRLRHDAAVRRREPRALRAGRVPLAAGRDQRPVDQRAALRLRFVGGGPLPVHARVPADRRGAGRRPEDGVPALEAGRRHRRRPRHDRPLPERPLA